MSGQFFDVTIESDRVIATARTPAAAARIPDRVATLRAIATLMPEERLPRVIHDSSNSVTMTRLPGDPIGREDIVREDAIEQVAHDLSAFLTTLHGIDTLRAKELGIPGPIEGRWRRFASETRTKLFPLMSEEGRARADRELILMEELPKVPARLIHGDLGGANMLFTKSRDIPHLTGVVDWDESHLGDPAEDLASLAATFGMDVMLRIVAQLGLDEAIAGRILMIQGTFALQQALAGFNDDDLAELDDGLIAYR
ncbi:MAG TPA: phosphotransferase [Thermomicrobiales bacterium]|nr:phosphotransferase [Thermomicrobiales bacterium]